MDGPLSVFQCSKILIDFINAIFHCPVMIGRAVVTCPIINNVLNKHSCVISRTLRYNLADAHVRPLTLIILIQSLIKQTQYKTRSTK